MNDKPEKKPVKNMCGVWVSVDTKTQLEIMAQEQNRTLSNLIEWIILEHLKQPLEV